MGTDLIVWTIRLALGCYLLSLGILLFPQHGTPRSRTSLRAAARLLWTAGCLAYLAHVAAAFHFQHGWSHERAYEHTARRTWEMTGWRWGGGLNVNYLFTLLWIGDTAWWWAGPDSHRARPAWIAAALHGFMLFVAFNATVVFGAGLIRWCGLAATGLLAAAHLAAAWRRWRAARRAPREGCATAAKEHS